MNPVPDGSKTRIVVWNQSYYTCAFDFASVSDSLFSIRNHYKLSTSVRGAISYREGEIPLYACIADIYCPDPSPKQSEYRKVIMVVTNHRLHIINTQRNIIFYPNYQVGERLRTIDLDSIRSIKDKSFENLSIMDIQISDQDPLIVLDMRGVSRFEGLKIMPGGKITHREFIESLNSLLRESGV